MNAVIYETLSTITDYIYSIFVFEVRVWYVWDR